MIRKRILKAVLAAAGIFLLAGSPALAYTGEENATGDVILSDSPVGESRGGTETIPAAESGNSVMPDESEEGEKNPFTKEGNGTLIDEASEKDGKIFYTIDTEDGNTFYLIIDKQRGGENVYMTSLIDTEKLKSFAKEEKTVNTLPSLSESDLFTKKEEAPEEEKKEEEKPEKKGGIQPGAVLFPLAAGGAAAGIWYYRKKRSDPYIEEYDTGADSYLDEDDTGKAGNDRAVEQAGEERTENETWRKTL